MIEITIDKADVQRINTVLARLDSKAQDNLIKRGVLKASTFVLNVLLTNVSGIILKIRTGNLARSMGMRVEKIGNDWQGVVGSGALVINPQLAEEGTDTKPVYVDKTFRMVYADRLEDGGIVTPTGGRKFLTLPLNAAKTPAGVTRFTAPQVRTGQTDYDGSVVIFPYIYGYKEGFGGRGKFGVTKRKLTPLFKLVSSVNVPAKHYLSRTAEVASPQVGQLMVEEIEKGLNE